MRVVSLSVSFLDLRLNATAVLDTTAEVGELRVRENETDSDEQREDRHDDSNDGGGDSETIRVGASASELASVDSVEYPGEGLEQEARKLDEPELQVKASVCDEKAISSNH